jgi:hypothetical protein
MGEREPDRTGVLPVEDRTGFAGALDLRASLGRHLALAARPALRGGDAEWERFEAVAGWGPLALSAGRQPVGYGYGAGGGVILSGAVALDRVQLSTTRPFTLPWVLRHLGPVSLHAFGSRLGGERHRERRPYAWGASGAVRPHPRFTLSVHRAAMFGGRNGDSVYAVTPGRILDMLIGRVEGIGFENQEVSAEARLRLPTERFLPATVYVEWGSEDAAGSWMDVPGRVMGVYLPALPALPQVALGVERAAFAPSCCGNPSWYRHLFFPGAWAAGDLPLGRELGGHGSELLLYAEAELLDSRLRLAGRGFRREREAENLFVPGREGRSTGVSAELLWRLGSGADLRLRGAREAGEEWSQHALELGTRIFF